MSLQYFFCASSLLSVFVLYTLLSCPLFSLVICYYFEQKQKKIYYQISLPAVGLLSMTSRGKLSRTLQDVWMFTPTSNLRSNDYHTEVGGRNMLKEFCSLERAFSNYDERRTNEMHFQSKPYISNISLAATCFGAAGAPTSGSPTDPDEIVRMQHHKCRIRKGRDPLPTFTYSALMTYL
jgi:hypothetical protein